MAMPPVRAERLAMADRRAMEEQRERTEDVKGMPQKALPLAGGAKKGKAHKSPVDAPSFNPAEIEGFGRRMAEHIDGLHGGAYRAAFMRGMSAYGNPEVSAAPVSFSNTVEQKSKVKGGMRRMVGAGPLKIEIEHDKMEGGMQTGRFEGEGRADGRKARAAIVKKVMAERGCSMAQASRYVKEHNLYPSKAMAEDK